MEEWKYRPAADAGIGEAKRWRSLEREPGLASTAAHSLWCAATLIYFRLYHRLSVTGAEHIPPSAPFVMVGNHASHLDAVVLAASLPPRLRAVAFPIAAGDTFFETPVIAALAAGVLNALPLWRKQIGAHALEKLRARLISEPIVYILFPEGTRSRTGEMAHFKSGIGMLVNGTAVPVLPAHLSGAHTALPPDKRIPRPASLSLLIGRGRTFDHLPNVRSGWTECARLLEADVRDLGGLRG